MEKISKKIHKLSLFIFRRDLRLYDNTGLFHALRLSEQVVPCFIFDINQIDPSKNQYFSHNLVQFMIESLKDLNSQLSKHQSRLYFFHGEIEATFRSMLEKISPDAVFVNEDVTPYSIKRDNKLQDVCKESSIKFYSYPDIMLIQKDKVMLTGGRFYQKFTPYYKTAIGFPVSQPEPNNHDNYLPATKKFNIEYSCDDLDKFYKKNPELEVHGGRTEALKIINNLNKFKNYEHIRNFPALETSKLSAYNKFGCVSIREIYHEAKKLFGINCTFIQQLFWRDFYYNITFYYPHVFGNPMKMKYKDIAWENNQNLFEKWKNGKTGCPIVDSAMRHLNTKGYMPNRLRMVVANYLVKDLLIDWKWGEQYFAQKLVDYDPSQNSGGWQWAAGCGTDSQPYFRIFNPKLQSEKFDKNCDYILKWIPELKSVKKEHIHDWESHYKLYKDKKIDYPDPIVTHAVQKQKCLKMYKDTLYGDEKEEEKEEEDEEEEEEEKSKSVDAKKSTRKRRATKELSVDAKKAKKSNSDEIEKSAKKKVSQTKNKRKVL